MLLHEVVEAPISRPEVIIVVHGSFNARAFRHRPRNLSLVLITMANGLGASLLRISRATSLIQSWQAAQPVPCSNRASYAITRLSKAGCLISGVLHESLLRTLQLTVIRVNQQAYFACIAPFSDVLFSLSFDDFVYFVVL